MSKCLNEQLSNICKEEKAGIIFNEILKKHTTFCVGGKCRAFISVNSEAMLIRLLKLFDENNAEYTIIGKGSNIIVSDKGYDGYVINIGREFSSMEICDDRFIRSQSGASLRALGNFALENSLTGAECLHGIPGSVGGAVYMNAGAYGGEIADVVKSVVSVTRKGEIKEYTAEELDFSYRRSVFFSNNEIVLSALFEFRKGNYNEIKSKMGELSQKRKDKQPLEYPSAGSTFKRPAGSYASLLIEECGLKGLCVGDAEVSVKHSGFIVNKGNATCSDIIELCRQVKKIVMEKTGYELELEPVILGNI